MAVPCETGRLRGGSRLALAGLACLAISGCSLIFETRAGQDAGIEEDGGSDFDAGDPVDYAPSNVGDFSFTDDARDCIVGPGQTLTVDTANREVRLDGERIAADDAPVIRRVNLAGGQAAMLLACRNFALDETAIVDAIGPLAIIVLASEEITLEGTVDVSATGSNSGPGGFNNGPGTPSTIMEVRASGSGGSYGSAGGNGARELGPDEFTYGTPELVPLVGGSGGALAGSPSFTGGGGGGAIQFSAAIRVTVAGLINAGGGGGRGAGTVFARAGAGGGSGGAVLLEAPEVVIALTGYVGANGGGGGGGAGDGMTSNGLDGADASDLPAQGGDASPDDRRGGDGAYGDRPPGDGLTPSDAGGGGGGGFGRIRINTLDKSESDYPQGLSPQMGSGATTLGMLPLPPS